MSTNFRLELIEPSPREGEGQQLSMHRITTIKNQFIIFVDNLNRNLQNTVWLNGTFGSILPQQDKRGRRVVLLLLLFLMLQ